MSVLLGQKVKLKAVRPIVTKHVSTPGTPSSYFLELVRVSCHVGVKSHPEHQMQIWDCRTKQQYLSCVNIGLLLFLMSGRREGGTSGTFPPEIPMLKNRGFWLTHYCNGY